ncbi:MAG: hypothetical protein HGB32_15065 [Geobacteraceae bacterium]|nr:hypothetical protein [Geobacteraceae bacterium]NTW81444.1 hypothetical protein [Geobacteraceae bacterium]
MSKQLIILVHGMGTHHKGNMLKEYKKAIADRASGFGISDPSFLSNVDYEEFNYSEYFDAIRKQFAENAQARQKGFAYLTGMGFEEKLLGQLTRFESNFGKDEFFYTHWLDVILYSTMYFGEKVRVDFIAFFEELRKKYDHKNIHIICHSLGTAVVHDALAKYYRINSDPFDDIPDLKTGGFNIASLWTFANVSRMVNLLNDLKDPNHSTVVTGKDGCTSNFVNIRHEYDPFTWFKTYDRKMEDSTTFVNTVFKKINTHDFYEYVTEPAVARAILNFIYGNKITPAQFDEGLSDYQKGSLGQEVKELKDLIDAAVDDPSINSVKAAIDQFKVIQKKIDELS